MDVKKVGLRVFLVLSSIALIAVLGCQGLATPPEEGGDILTPDISIGTPALNPGSVTEGQASEPVEISVTISRIDGGNEDSVAVTGSSIPNQNLGPTSTAGLWTGTIYPDANSSSSGDTLDFTITAQDSANGVTKQRVFSISVVGGGATDAF